MEGVWKSGVAKWSSHSEGVQPSPIKSSINDGSFDGNYWGGTGNTSTIQ